MVDRSTKFQIGALGGAWTVDNLLQTHIANTDLQEYVQHELQPVLKPNAHDVPKLRFDVLLSSLVSYACLCALTTHFASLSNNGPYSPTVPDLTRKAQVRANLSQFAIGVASCKQVGVDFVLVRVYLFLRIQA